MKINKKVIRINSIIMLLLCSTLLIGCSAIARSCSRAAAKKASRSAVKNTSDDLTKATVKSSARKVESNSAEKITVERKATDKNFNLMKTNPLTTLKNTKKSYVYQGKTYNNLVKIPFSNTHEKIFTSKKLSLIEAHFLASKNINFVYNLEKHNIQGNKKFKVIFIISEDIPTTMELYDIDASMARKLINYSLELDASVLKVPSFKRAQALEDQIIKKGEVPIIIYHNSPIKQRLLRFKPSSNLITCNSYILGKELNVITTNYLDMKGIIKGINKGINQVNLENFYDNLSTGYSQYIKDEYYKNCLLYIGGGATLTSTGVGIIAYYNNPSES